jgi:hypothetical protein
MASKISTKNETSWFEVFPELAGGAHQSNMWSQPFKAQLFIQQSLP